MRFLSRRGGLTPEQRAKLDAAATRPIYLQTFTTPAETYTIDPGSGNSIGNAVGDTWEQDYTTTDTLVLGSVVFGGLYGSATATYTVGLRLNGLEVARASIRGDGGSENRTLTLPAGLVWDETVDKVTLFGTATGDSPWVVHAPPFDWDGTPIQQAGGQGHIVSFVTVSETIAANTKGPLDSLDFPRVLTSGGLGVGGVARVTTEGDRIKQRLSEEAVETLAYLSDLEGLTGITPEQQAQLDSIPDLAESVTNLAAQVGSGATGGGTLTRTTGGVFRELDFTLAPSGTPNLAPYTIESGGFTVSGSRLTPTATTSVMVLAGSDTAARIEAEGDTGGVGGISLIARTATTDFRIAFQGDGNVVGIENGSVVGASRANGKPIAPTTSSVYSIEVRSGRIYATVNGADYIDFTLSGTIVALGLEGSTVSGSTALSRLTALFGPSGISVSNLPDGATATILGPSGGVTNTWRRSGLLAVIAANGDLLATKGAVPGAVFTYVPPTP